MLSWVVKVVPQPPDTSGKKAEEEKPAAPTPAPAPAPPPAPPPAPEKKVTFKEESKAPIKPQAPKVDKIKEDARVTEENGAQPGMLTWISQGFMLPQPGSTPKPGRANAKAKEENAVRSTPEEEGGVVGWIVHGLGKVVPQPDVKYKEELEPEEVTEVYNMADVPDAEPLPHIPVTEVQSDHEDAMDNNKPFPPSVIEWIKHGIEKVVPQPEIYIHAKPDVPVKSDAATPKKAEAPVTPPEPKPAVEGERMVGWIVQGIGRLLPQPASKTDSSDEVQNRARALTAP